MMRTLRFQKIGQHSPRKRAAGHESPDLTRPVPPARSGQGTPWPPPDVLAKVDAVDWDLDDLDGLDGLDEYEDVDRAPVPLEVDDDAPASPLYLEAPEDLEIDIRTRTLMGTGARAVRAVAKSGCMEARVATRGLRATPAAPPPQVMPPVGEVAAPPRVIVSPSASVQPPHLSPDESSFEPAEILPPPRRRPGGAASPSSAPEPATSLSARITLPAGSPEAQLISALVAAQDARALAPTADQAAVATLYVRGADRMKARRASSSSSYRVFAILLLAAGVAALAAYLATSAFLGGAPLGL